MSLLTYTQTAERLGVSVSSVRTLARAAEISGAVSPEQLAPRLRRYLHSGFPRPVLIGGSRRLARIDAGELEQWLATCPRPINTATDHSAKWCKRNGHCGCVEIDVLRKEYGEVVYPPR